MSLFLRRGKDSSGVARRLCLLEQARGRGLEPLGLVGWEVGSEPQDGQNDAVTSLVASQGPCFIEDDRPRPTAPLIVEARPGLLRRLHLCTPSEAPALGVRLSVQAGSEARESAPPELAELIERYLGSPHVASSIAHGDDGPLLPWVTPWPRAALLEDLREAPPPRRAGAAPTTLVPLGLLFDPPGLPLAAIEEVMSDATLLRGTVTGTGFRVIPSRITPLMVSLVLPLRGADWRHALGGLRDEIGRRLGTAPGWFPLLPEDLVALCRRLFALHAPAKGTGTELTF